MHLLTVWQASWHGIYPNNRGVNVMLVDPFSCSVQQESLLFDTAGDPNAATALTNYLQQVNRGNIIVGLTGDEPTNRLSSALPTLRGNGVDVADVQWRGSFAFVAQKGFPTKTVLRKVLTDAESNAHPAQFNATVTGAFDCKFCHLFGMCASVKIFNMLFSPDFDGFYVSSIQKPLELHKEKSLCDSSVYRTMHYSAKHSLAIACRLSVCLSVHL